MSNLIFSVEQQQAYLSMPAVIALLVDEGVLQCEAPILVRRPKHGPCCTCQDCGHAHDECVCQHNRILESLEKIAAEASP